MDDKQHQILDGLFHPRSVAVVGVSDRVTNHGINFLKSNRAAGFRGPLYAIHPEKKIPDFETYPSLSAVPGPVDYAIICVKAHLVPGVAAEAAAKGARCVAVFSSGFSESAGREGIELEDRLAAAIAGSSTRLLGPNCMGLYCPENGLSIRPEMPGATAGNVALLAQSGGITISLILSAATRGLGVGKAVSYGNELDLGPAELLDYLARDPATAVICLYIEGSRRPGELRASLTRAAAVKPVIILKGGATRAGSRAAASHTGALAGSSEIWSAMAAQAGAIMVRGPGEMIDLAALFSRGRPPAGLRLAVMSISGGLGVVAADAVERAGFEVPALHPETQRALGEIMRAPGTSVANPVDMAAQFYLPENHRGLFAAVDADPGTDAILLVGAMEYLGMMGPDSEARAAGLTRSVIAALVPLEKPVYVALLPTAYEAVRQSLVREFGAAGFPAFNSLSGGLTALSRAMRRGPV